MGNFSRREFTQATLAALGGVGLMSGSRMPAKLAVEPPPHCFPSNAIPAERVGANEGCDRTGSGIMDPRRHSKKLRLPG